MSIAVDVSADGVRLPVARARVAAAVRLVLERERTRHAMVSVAFVSRAAITRLNREHLGHAGATDVISFALATPGNGDGPVIGDIYICPDVARDNARRFGTGVREELMRLAIHGTLHVLGYDHPETEEERLRSEMWRRQERLVASARERVGW